MARSLSFASTSQASDDPTIDRRAAYLEQRLPHIARDIVASGVISGFGTMGERTLPSAPRDLSPRESEVLNRLLRGERVPRIARTLHRTQSTIRNHLASIYRKLDVSCQQELIDLFRPGAQGEADRLRVSADSSSGGTQSGALSAELDLRALEVIPQMVWVTDANGAVVFLSQKSAMTLGLDPDAVRGIDWLDFLHPEDVKDARPLWQRALHAGTAFDIECRLRQPNGGYRWYSAKAVALPGPDDSARRWIGTWTEVDERRSLEEKLWQAQKMATLGQLAAGVAHDFNNLLSVIIGYSDILLKSLGDDVASSGQVAEIRTAAERSAALSEQLLALCRKQAPATGPIDMNDVIQNVESMLRRIIGADVDLRVDLQPQLEAVESDPAELERILVNLAVNARDAMPRGGSLTIRTRNVSSGRQDGPVRQVLLAITDTGEGMPDEVKQRLFEPFFTTKGPDGPAPVWWTVCLARDSTC